MSQVRISFAEKPMLNYLSKGGHVDDSEFQNYLQQFLQTAMMQEEINEVMRNYSLSAFELYAISSTLLAAFPTKVLDVGGPLLVQTLVYMEPFRLASIARLIKSYEDDGKTHNEAIFQAAYDVGNIIVDAHSQAGKVKSIANVTEKSYSNSCLSTIIGIIITVGLALALRQCFKQNAIEESNGDDARARSIYIRLRASGK